MSQVDGSSLQAIFKLLSKTTSKERKELQLRLDVLQVGNDGGAVREVYDAVCFAAGVGVLPPYMVAMKTGYAAALQRGCVVVAEIVDGQESKRLRAMALRRIFCRAIILDIQQAGLPVVLKIVSERLCNIHAVLGRQFPGYGKVGEIVELVSRKGM